MSTPDGPHGLGGRLALLRADELNDDQRAVHDQLEMLVGPESRHDGFIAQLDDGRFIGPFNAMLRAPHVTAGFGAWVRAIAQAGLPDDVRQVVILTVAAAWRADYEIYAHTAAARVAGIPDEAVTAILAGEPPSGVSAAAALAYDLVRGLLHAQDVADPVYGESIRIFGEGGTIAILGLVAQYQLVSSLLVCFRVPAPSTIAGQEVHMPVSDAADTASHATSEPGPDAGRHSVAVVWLPGEDAEPVVETIELPSPGPDEVRVRVIAVGVNPTDWKSLERTAGPRDAPVRLGLEAAGVIDEVGSAVHGDQFAVGDAVIVFPARGAYASDLVVPLASVLRKPDTLSFPQAANLLLAGTTAAEMLHVVPVDDGQTVLVHAASSACGISLVQQIAAQDVRVLGTCSAHSADLVASYGAIPIEYGSGLADRVREAAPDGVDAAFDCAGTDESMQVSTELVADQRRIISIVDQDKSRPSACASWTVRMR
ncbi:MAG: alcohol dehydrogenase catalytic domain-containing protein [Actinomycetota bacterium]|nr:alcohol dehydrogenase catalytic domain-containing protein [Actinomycetota bacterium]